MAREYAAPQAAGTAIPWDAAFCQGEPAPTTSRSGGIVGMGTATESEEASVSRIGFETPRAEI